MREGQIGGEPAAIGWVEARLALEWRRRSSTSSARSSAIATTAGGSSSRELPGWAASNDAALERALGYAGRRSIGPAEGERLEDWAESPIWSRR